MLMLKTGDKITVISVNRCVFRAVVVKIYVTGIFDWWAELIGRGEAAALCNEGITWIRGTHADDSKEVAAMLVAFALGGDLASDSWANSFIEAR